LLPKEESVSHIFVSYSRKDLKIARPIVNALTKDNLDVWVDWEDIPRGEEFEREIQQGIEGSDIFLFLASPDSVQSEWCNKEIAHAVKNGKRILPIVIRDADPKIIHPEISKRNWIFCRDGQDDFNKAIEETRKTIHTDYEWLKYHTRLQVKALEWERRKDFSHLLYGNILREAEEQLAKARSDQDDPLPTDLQRLFVLNSRKFEKNLKAWGGIAIGVIMITLLIFWTRPYWSRERAVPGKWVTISEGKFTIGLDQIEAETAYALCKQWASEPGKDCPPSVADMLNWAGKTNIELPVFEIMDNEVTNAQYQQCINVGNCVPPVEWKYEEGGANKPATGLNWFQAGKYCAWLEGRLPTEVEWEKAASGPNGENNYFPWGNAWDPTKANLKQSGVGEVQSIIQYANSDVSVYGVKNLAGNVREWTASESIPLDANQISMNVPLNLEDNGEYFPVIVRGGAWISEPSLGMSSIRGTDGTIKSRDTLGFRCVCPTNQTCNSPWNLIWMWFGKY